MKNRPKGLKYKKHRDNLTSFRKMTWEEYQGRYIDSEGTKACRTCGIRLPFQVFPNNSSSPFGKLHDCRECHNSRCRSMHRRIRASNPEYMRKARDRYTRRKYNLTQTQYDTMLRLQRFCAICREELLGRHQSHLDHCHEADKIREFLCTNCNRGLGHFKDNLYNLQNAQLYLEKHNG